MINFTDVTNQVPNPFPPQMRRGSYKIYSYNSELFVCSSVPYKSFLDEDCDTKTTVFKLENGVMEWGGLYTGWYIGENLERCMSEFVQQLQPA